jgi:hypothetical protein
MSTEVLCLYLDEIDTVLTKHYGFGGGVGFHPELRYQIPPRPRRR